MVMALNYKKLILLLLLLTLIGGLIYANSTEEQQASKAATAAAKNGMDEEMAVIETASVKPKNTSNINWTEINKYDRQLKQINKEYSSLLTKADTEKTSNNGNVTDATRQAGQASAKKFDEVSEQLALALEKQNCKTRAKSARAAGKARLANAEMAFNNVNSDAINAYNDQSGMMVEANTASMKDIKADASDADVAKLKANLIPQFNKMIADNTRLMGQVTQLLDQVRRASGGDVGAMAGCAKGIVSGASDGPGGLLKPVMSLMNLVKGMGSNMASTLQALMAL